eukprot:TRINITY_DN460_c4_g1_i1.p1 TRINITY_DN460_c4_g1~~TRINITY_DN460_c4_g1_i1.p1  ORF type:complete len:410 (+),score=77.71 TRINITY_DN460_c4_g1_i1:54-1232(+)
MEFAYSSWMDLMVKGAAVGGVGVLLNNCRKGMKKPPVTDKIDFVQDTKRDITGVVLVNLGTPESCDVPSVKRFLKEFLSDERVIDMPPLLRYIIVNCFIAPFRSPESTETYKRVWDQSKLSTNLGSPLLSNGVDLLEKVKQQLGDKYSVKLAMRYQSPSIEKALLELKAECAKHIIVIPLFPQYSSSCTGSIQCKVFDCLRTWDRIPHLTISSSFLDRPAFAKCWADNGRELVKKDYDHFLFSYHGIPVSQLAKGSKECDPCTTCTTELTERNATCYRAQCYETTRLIVKELGLKEGSYSTSFQSRLGPTEWLQPYTVDTAEGMPERGIKKLLVFSPAFVADCLETIDEIGVELKDSFTEKGGEVLDLVPSLNSSDGFATFLTDMARNLSVF